MTSVERIVGTYYEDPPDGNRTTIAEAARMLHDPKTLMYGGIEAMPAPRPGYFQGQAGGGTAQPRTETAPPTSRLLPVVELGGVGITRLIAGGNPFRGYSHMSEALDREMREYYSMENVVQALFECERNGINTVLMRGDNIIFGILDAYREQGGSMHWIAQTASEKPDLYANIREIAARKPLAIYFHGSETDKRWKAGRIDGVRDYLKAIRDAGVAVGLGSHMPDALRYAEDRGWDVDFYMACLYNISKIDRGSILAGAPRVEEPFDDPDREIMFRFIRSTTKPCLAFKILAAGRKCRAPAMVRDAFAFAFSNIKSGDAVVVGMFQKHQNQIRENCGIVRGK